MSGPPPTPSKLKILRGNPRHRPINDDPVVPDGEIVPPKWLDAASKKHFLKFVPILKGMQVMTLADVETLATLAATYAEFISLERSIRKDGRSRKIYTEAGEKWAPNPAVAQRSDAAKRLKALFVEFGMTPSARSRIQVTPKAEEDDPFARYERQA